MKQDDNYTMPLCNKQCFHYNTITDLEVNFCHFEGFALSTHYRLFSIRPNRQNFADINRPNKTVYFVGNGLNLSSASASSDESAQQFYKKNVWTGNLPWFYCEENHLNERSV
jgi:hypothetical protein